MTEQRHEVEGRGAGRLYWSERNLREAVAAGETITLAEMDVILDRLVRTRAARQRLVDAIEELEGALGEIVEIGATLVIEDPDTATVSAPVTIHPDDLVKRPRIRIDQTWQQIARVALSSEEAGPVEKRLKAELERHGDDLRDLADEGKEG